MSFVDTMHGYAIATACGEADCSSEFYATTDGGVSWRWLYDFSPGHELAGVEAETPSDAFFYGAEVLVTHDGGKTFADVSHPTGALGPTIDMAASGGSIWRVTQDATCSGTEGCGVAILTSIDSGRTWKAMRAQPVSHAGAVQLVRTGPRVAWALVTTPEGRNDLPIRTTADGGASWHDARNPCADTAYDRDASIASPDGVILWLVCGAQPSSDTQKRVVFRSRDRGSHWEIPNPGPVSGTSFHLASNDPDRAWLSSIHSPVGASEDDGRTWGTRISYRDNTRWGPVVFVGRDHGWIAYGDEILRTTDGGHSWRHVILPLPTPG